MKWFMLAMLAVLVWLLPAFALAEGAGGSYRGIASMYYFLIAVVLIFGVYDVFGKKTAMYAAPVILVGSYFMLPAG